MLQRHKRTDLLETLQRIDRELKEPCEIVLIGGAALSLGFGGESTADIDLWSPKTGPFWEAVARLRRTDPLFAPIQPVGIATEPLHFESRLFALPIKGCGMLTVLIPEAHDLALLKTARATSHDLDAIEALSRTTHLKLETLIERYRESKTQVIGPAQRFRNNFLALVERLYGENTAVALEKTLD